MQLAAAGPLSPRHQKRSPKCKQLCINVTRKLRPRYSGITNHARTRFRKSAHCMQLRGTYLDPPAPDVDQPPPQQAIRKTSHSSCDLPGFPASRTEIVVQPKLPFVEATNSTCKAIAMIAAILVHRRRESCIDLHSLEVGTRVLFQQSCCDNSHHFG